VLAARLLIRELDTVAARAGVRFTLLKGAAVAANPARQPLDLGDVDELTATESEERAWSALLPAGWSPIAPGLRPTDELGIRPHFAPLRSARHQLPLELHARFDYRLDPVSADHAPDARPIPGYRTLDRLAGPRAIAATPGHLS
jgi:hypothetical protein